MGRDADIGSGLLDFRPPFSKFGVLGPIAAKHQLLDGLLS
jgi:hypothetical protein